MTILEAETNWTWSHFLFGLTYSILASLIFLFIVLILFKPIIRISSFLCKESNNENTNQFFYVFKFVNISFFPAHDIKIELHKIKKIPMGNGKFNNSYHRLTLLSQEIFHIPARLYFGKKNDANPHCVTLRTTENINSILSDQFNAIKLRVCLKHGLTGLSKVFEQEYANESEIKDGKFKPGTKFALL